MDYLIQRFVVNVPNESEGAWQDIQVVRDLTADQAKDAVSKALDASGATGRVRCTRWDHIREFDASPGPAVLADRVKAEDPPA